MSELEIFLYFLNSELIFSRAAGEVESEKELTIKGTPTSWIKHDKIVTN